MKRWIICLLLCVVWLGVCGGSMDPPMRQASAESPTSGKRLFYIGLALYSESWSENDIVELAAELNRTSDFAVVPLIASNVLSVPRKFPIADDATIAAFVKTATERAVPGDIVLVHISTHGADGMLARKIGDGAPTALTARALARQLAPLDGRRTVIIISACYSGSLIGDLSSPQRIIVTSARADRSSFGCAAGNRHTFFGEAELYGFAQRDRSLRQVFLAIRGYVARMEETKRYRPSEPQVSVGADVMDLYNDPVF